MEAYRHQVGGHSRLMKPKASSKVYKPFSESEFRFYEKLASLGSTATDSGPLHVLKQFVPKYYGVTEVQVQTTSLPPIHFPPGAHRNSSTTTPTPSQSGANVNEEASKATPSDTPPTENPEHSSSSSSKAFDTEQPGDNTVTVSSTAGAQVNITPSQSSTNDNSDNLPSIDTGQQQQQATSSSSSCSSSSSSSVLKYMVLEDLVYQYKKPCVMDVKMGKRQRKIGASAEKEQRQLEKSLKTTSHAVGFRLCGMQFYDKKNDILCYRDKYWGRKLTKDKLRQSIGQWFWNGYIVYHELLLPLISSLKILYSCIAELRHYRFWSSSLLWVFDGGLTDTNGRIRSMDVRMIDFANTIVLKDNPSPDEEYLFGLGNLISILESLVFSPTVSPSGHSTTTTTATRENRLSISPTKRHQLMARTSCSHLALEKEVTSESQPTEESVEADDFRKFRQGTDSNEFSSNSTSVETSSMSIAKSHQQNDSSLSPAIPHHARCWADGSSTAELSPESQILLNHSHTISLSDVPMSPSQWLADSNTFELDHHKPRGQRITTSSSSRHRDTKHHHDSDQHLPPCPVATSSSSKSSTHQIPQFSDFLFNQPPPESIVVNSPKSIKSSTDSFTIATPLSSIPSKPSRLSPRSSGHRQRAPPEGQSNLHRTEVHQRHHRQQPEGQHHSRMHHHHLMKWQGPQQQREHLHSDLDNISSRHGQRDLSKQRSLSIPHDLEIVAPPSTQSSGSKDLYSISRKHRGGNKELTENSQPCSSGHNDNERDVVTILSQSRGTHHNADASNKRRARHCHHRYHQSTSTTTSSLQREIIGMAEEYDAGCRADAEESDEAMSSAEMVHECGSGYLAGVSSSTLHTIRRSSHSSVSERKEGDFNSQVSTSQAPNTIEVPSTCYPAAYNSMDLTPSSSSSVHYPLVASFDQAPQQKKHRRSHPKHPRTTGVSGGGCHQPSTRRRSILQEEPEKLQLLGDLTASSFHRKCVSAPSLIHLVDSCSRISSKQEDANDQGGTTYLEQATELPPTQQSSLVSPSSLRTIQESPSNGIVPSVTKDERRSESSLIMETLSTPVPTVATSSPQMTHSHERKARHGSNALGAFTLPSNVESLQLGRSDGSESYSSSSEDLVNQGDVGSDDDSGVGGSDDNKETSDDSQCVRSHSHSDCKEQLDT